MPGIRTDTSKLKEAAEILIGHCTVIRDSLNRLGDEIEHLEENMYCSAVPAYKREFSSMTARAMEHISSMEHHIENLSVIAKEYEDAERRNTDESYSIDRG